GAGRPRVRFRRRVVESRIARLEEKTMSVESESDLPMDSDKSTDDGRTAVPLEPSGEVVLSHRDQPAPSAGRQIHPRRTAPVIPTREERERSERVESGGQ